MPSILDIDDYFGINLGSSLGRPGPNPRRIDLAPPQGASVRRGGRLAIQLSTAFYSLFARTPDRLSPPPPPARRELPPAAGKPPS
jgi:hypothetical protein